MPEDGSHDPFNLVLDFKGEAVVIEINDNGRIPLNPHETEDYEVPDAGSEREALWRNYSAPKKNASGGEVCHLESRLRMRFAPRSSGQITSAFGLT